MPGSVSLVRTRTRRSPCANVRSEPTPQVIGREGGGAVARKNKVGNRLQETAEEDSPGNGFERREEEWSMNELQSQKAASRTPESPVGDTENVPVPASELAALPADPNMSG